MKDVRWLPVGLVLGAAVIALGAWLGGGWRAAAGAARGVVPVPAEREGAGLAFAEHEALHFASTPELTRSEARGEARGEARSEAHSRAPVDGPLRLISGRISIPEGLPAGSRTSVVLRTLADGRSDERRSSVDSSGSFALVVPIAWRYATLDLEGEHLYLDRPQRLQLETQGEDLLLEARLGGCLVVRFSGTHGAVPRESIGTRVELPTHGRRAARIDSRGRARFGGLPVGPVSRIEFDVPGFLQSPAEKLHYSNRSGPSSDGSFVESGATRELDLVLVRAARLEGRVLDATGLPFEGAVVSVGRSKATTDVQGRFELGDLRPGDVWVTAQHPEHADVDRRVEGLAEGEYRRGVGLDFDPARSLAGRVVWPDETPAEGAHVRAAGLSRSWGCLRPDGGDSSSPWHGPKYGSAVRTDGEGRFRLSGLVKGPYTLLATYDDPTSPSDVPCFEAQLEQVAEGDLEVLLVLQAVESHR